MRSRETALLLAALALSCFPAAGLSASPQRPLVLVSVEPLAAIVRDVAGDLVDVEVAVPPGQEPHSFQATPDLVDLAGRASLFVTVAHLPVEEQLAEVADCPVIGLEDYRAEGLRLLQMPGGEGEDIHGFWLLPDNAVAVAAAVSRSLAEIDPEHASEYAAGLERFGAEVGELKSEMAELSASLNLRGQGVLVSTPAEVYLAAALGMVPASSIVRGPNALIGPAEAAEIGSAMDRGEIRFVMVSDAVMGTKAADYALQLSSEHGAALLRSSILNVPAGGYLGYMERNLGMIEGSLRSGSPAAGSRGPGLGWECAAWVVAASALAVAAAGVAIWRA